MTTFTAITTAQIDAESYVDTTLAGQWANNVLAMFEGDASASAVRLQILALDDEIKPWIELEQDVITASTAYATFENIDVTNYDQFMVTFDGAQPITAANYLVAQFGYGGGTTTWWTGGADYSYHTTQTTSAAATYAGAAQSATTSLRIGGAASSNDTGKVNGDIRFNNNDALSYVEAHWKGSSWNSNHKNVVGSGSVLDTAQMTAIRLTFSASNIEQGVFTLYGRRK